MLFYLILFLSICCGLLVLVNSTRKKEESNKSIEEGKSTIEIEGDKTLFNKFQMIYLLPFLCMTCGDWLQGAYTYVLYESYGYHIDDISKLFILGFFSSMIFGTFIGSLGDKFGRKFLCLIFVVLYSISCLTKHSSNYLTLLFGRLTGGISTSILFSSFESWMVSEHQNNFKFPPEWISDTFYKQSFYNGLIAIFSGFLSSFLYNYFDKSAVAPFDAAIFMLTIGGIFIYFNWKENYGDTTGSTMKNFGEGLNAMKRDIRIICVAISQSFFEAAMYIFVFMWTPTLTKSDNNVYGKLDHGNVFACFMIAVMIGSNIFNIMVNFKSNNEWLTNPEKFLLIVFGISLFSLSIPLVSNDFLTILFSFLAFEVCVGIFWPAISTLKSIYIPSDVRSTVMNYFRIPTNLLVVLSLIYASELPQFNICCGMLIISFVAQLLLIYINTQQKRAASNIVIE
ncbi:hypothetical protein ABK040_007871 [Willaertia magna]